MAGRCILPSVSRLLAGVVAVPFAAATALLAVAGANVGYGVQPAWFVFAAISGALTLVLAGVCLAGTARPTRSGWFAGVVAIAAFVTVVAVVTPSQPSKRHAREVGLRMLGRVAPYPGAQVTGYVLDSFGPGGDYGPSYLRPPDGYSLSRSEVLPHGSDARSAVQYYRQALRTIGFRTTVDWRANDAGSDPADPTIAQVAPVGDAPVTVIVLWQDHGRLHAEVSASQARSLR